MSYSLNGESFKNKEQVRDRCREILNKCKFGEFVSGDEKLFLVELFSYHDEWQQKSQERPVEITSMRSECGTKCFAIIPQDGKVADISFVHCIKLLPTKRRKAKIPQSLINYRNAGRTAISGQIKEFRDKHLSSHSICQITGEPLTIENCAVDHVEPLSFDRLLNDFTRSRQLRYEVVEVVSSADGTVAEFADSNLVLDWREYHRSFANLRLITRSANLKIRHDKVDWSVKDATRTC